jgi:hypothetical protein
VTAIAAMHLAQRHEATGRGSSVRPGSGTN